MTDLWLLHNGIWLCVCCSIEQQLVSVKVESDFDCPAEAVESIVKLPFPLEAPPDLHATAEQAQIIPGQHSSAIHLEHKKDMQHLHGLPNMVASTVDMVLTAAEGEHQTDFPVHQVIVARHSPVLCSMLEELQSGDIKQSASQQKPLCLPMVGDSCSAIRAALTTMYRSEQRTVNSIETEQENFLSLGMIPVQASLTEFAHKYGMTEVLIAQEAALLQPFYDIADGHLRQDVCLKILVCAAAAVKYKLDALLSMCEAHLITHFQCFMPLRDKVSSILPPKACTEWQNTCMGKDVKTRASAMCLKMKVSASCLKMTASAMCSSV